MVDQGEARELRHRATGEGAPALEQPGHVGQLAAPREVEQRPRVPAVPEQPDHVRRTAFDEVVEHHPVEVREIGALDAGQPRQRRHDVDQPRVPVDEPPSAYAGPGEQQRRT